MAKDGHILSQATDLERIWQRSSGSFLRQHLVEKNGKQVVETADLFDYDKTFKLLRISYSRKEVIEVRCLQRPNPTFAHPDIPPGPSDEMILGVRASPIEATATVQGKKQVIGKAWISPDVGMFALKEDTTVQMPDGTRHHVVVQTLELKFEEPPAALFQVDSTFAPITREKQVCTNPH